MAPHLGDNALPPAARRTHPLLLSPRTLDPTSLVPRDPPHPILSAQDTAHNGRGIVAISQHFTLTACLHHVEDVSKPTNSSFPPPHANTLIKNHTHTQCRFCLCRLLTLQTIYGSKSIQLQIDLIFILISECTQKTWRGSGSPERAAEVLRAKGPPSSK